ncbi:hypothetical protein LCGC14_1036260 [marine sediment metagenome]|uniref:Uncharacterized protein n=1 Tax=marine sediment metagenome TaxID=412755 RepID=A0A0F9NER4_9ZZZZ
MAKSMEEMQGEVRDAVSECYEAASVCCPKCGSTDCERFVESDAPPGGVNVICGKCGELFDAAAD